MAANDAELEETRAFNRRLEELLATVAPAHTQPPEETRRARWEGRGPFPAPEVLPQGQDRTIEGPAGPIPLRVFVPDTVDGVYLHVHGGGWVLGDARAQDPALWRLATSAGVAVVSVEYRLAPEHPFPAGADDCEAAALWLVEHAGDEFGTDRLVIGGGSAGAHLAALTLLRLRDGHGLTGAFAGADLVYGVYDLSMTPSQRRWGDRYLVLSTPLMAWFYDCFLPGTDPEARRDPGISPLYAGLHDLPPALFTVGTMDPLLDDTLFMEARWRQAGNATEVLVLEEAVHGFTAFPIGVARRAADTSADFVRRMVARER